MLSGFLLVTCGVPKTGKTAAVLEAFQDSLLILSSRSNSYYYEKRTRSTKPFTRMVGGVERKFHYRAPKKIKLIDTHSTNLLGSHEEYTWDVKPKTQLGKWMADANGTRFLQVDPEGTVPMPVRQMEELEKTILHVVSLTVQAENKGEPPPFKNVIIDEWGKFMDRVYEEILPSCLSASGKINPLAAFPMIGAWVEKMMNWLKQLTARGVNVCIVCHDRDPSINQKGESRPGGPKAPSAAVAYNMVGLADGCIQRYFKDPEPGAKNEDGTPKKTQRLWRVSGSEQWNVGLRGIEPEEEDLCATKELYDILVEHVGLDL